MKIYHTETQADYYALLVELEEQGYSWMYGGKPTEWHDEFWEFYKENTCVRVKSNKQIHFCEIDYYKEEYPDTPIIKYKEKQECQTPPPCLVNEGDKQMKKEFYIGQPLIIKDTGERVNFAYEDNGSYPCNIFGKEKGDVAVNYYKYEEVEPSTEFKFSEIIAGLEQGYFEVGTKFRRLSTDNVFTVKESFSCLYLQGEKELPSLTSLTIHSTWELVGDSKEMTLEEIEAELGYKIKLKKYV